MTTFSNIFSINGVIDTSKPVMDNMNILAAACSSWITFDVHEGKWSVVVNEPGSSIASFTDSNIIGGITVTTSGIRELYNKVQLQFPHKDLNDQIDTITYEIPSGQRYPYEYDNTLNYQFDCINDPVQAEYLAAIQLKQSRVDKVVQFRTDFTKIGIKAGDIIDITNSYYGFSSKLFRVLSIAEEDAEDGGILISITAFEYDSDVYSSSGLVRTETSSKNDINSSCTNTAIAESEQAANEASLLQSLVPLAAAYGLNSLWDLLFGGGPGGKLSKKLAEALLGANPTITASATNVCEGNSVIFTIQVCCNTCQKLDGVSFDYKLSGLSASDITVPLTGTISVDSTGVGTLTVGINNNSVLDGDRTLTFECAGTTKSVTVKDRTSYSLVAGKSTLIEGENTSVVVTTSGVANGTSKNYTIEGTGVEQLSGTPTSGSVTINNNSATIPIATKQTQTETDTQLTINFDPGTFYCSGSSINIAITHTYTPPPPPPADTNCEWVTIPLAWCGTFDGTTGNLKSVFPISTITVLKAISGQSSLTVPLTASVVGTTISVATTVDIDASTRKGGTLANIITSFDAWTPGVKRITGTTTQVSGY